MRKSGYRIDMHQGGEYEITYFGNFTMAISSQTLFVRNKADLEDLRDAIDRNLKMDKQNANSK